MREQRAASIWTAEFSGFIFLSVLLCMGGAAVLPNIPNIMRASGVGEGLLTASFVALLVGRLLASVFAGRLMSRLRPQSVLLGGLVLEISTMVCLAFLSHGVTFAIFRFLEGVFEGVVSVVLQVLIIGLSSPSDRGVKMGYMQSAFGLGFVVGPVFGALIMGLWGHSALFLAVAALFLTALVWLAALSPRLSNVIGQPSGAVSRLDAKLLLRLPAYSGAVLQRLSLVALSMLLPMTLVDRLAFKAHEVGYFFTFSAVITTILMPFTARRVTDAQARTRVVWAMLVMCSCFILMGVTRDRTAFAAAFALETAAFGVMVPNAMKVFGDSIASSPDRADIVGTCSAAREFINIAATFTLVPMYFLHATLPWFVVGAACVLLVVPYVTGRLAFAAAAQSAPIGENGP